MGEVLTTIVDEGLGNSSYLVELGGGRALAVDPTRDPSGYLAEADRRRLRIAYSVETHLHADFVSGSRELAALGATVVASAAGGLEFPHRPLADGDEVDLGGLRLRALATPATPPNTSPTSSPTGTGHRRCSAAGRSWSAPSPAPT